MLSAKGDSIDVPMSTHCNEISFILVDGNQFISSASRWKVEFDHDHAISNSMRPPPVPLRTKLTAQPEPESQLMPRDLPEPQNIWFQDSDFVKENDGGTQELLTHVAGAGANTDKAHVTSTGSEPAEIVSSGEQDEDITSVATFEPALSSEDPAEFTPKTPTQTNQRCLPHTTLTPDDFGHSDHATSPITSQEKHNECEPPSESDCDTSREKIIITGAARANGKVPLKVAAAPLNMRPFARNLGEESPILMPPLERNVFTQDLGNVSQEIKETHAVSFKGLEHEKPLEQPSSLHESSVLRRKSGDAAEILQRGPSALQSQDFVEQDPLMHLGNELASTYTSTRGRSSSNRHSTTSGDAQHTAAASLPRRTKPHTAPQKSLKPHDTIIVNVPQLYPRTPVTILSEASKSDPPSKRLRSRRGSIGTTESQPAKRQRLSKSVPFSIDLPSKPRVVFSRKSTIQNKKRTMETFSELGGEVVEDISDADILCTTTPLKKTSNLVLAVALGKAIVTEDWIIECQRRQAFPDPGSFVPKDVGREREWKFSLIDAVRRGQNANSGLSKIFESWNIYMTPQLQQKLGDLKQDFQRVASALGANRIYMRLPTGKGKSTRVLVLGDNNDWDAMKVGQLGYGLYSKDVLTMAALRGHHGVDTDEFKLKTLVKSEPHS